MIDPGIKILLGFDPDTDDDVFSREWEKRTKNVCKPCWELKYCPYGPLVEEYPLVGPTRDEAVEHQEFLKAELDKGTYEGDRKKWIEEMVETFNAGDYPVENPKDVLEKACSVFGHICPVFFVNEPFTETRELRRIGRNIPRDIMLRVVRRDNNQCQICGNVLRDDEIELDHIIPLNKGGCTEEHNIRVTCQKCNRHKSDKVEL